MMTIKIVYNVHPFITWLSCAKYMLIIRWLFVDHLIIWWLMNNILRKMCWKYVNFDMMITWRSNDHLFNSDYHTSNICVPFVHYPCHKITAWWSLVNHLLIIQRLSYLYINEDYQLIILLSLEDLMILFWLCEDLLIITWR